MQFNSVDFMFFFPIVVFIYFVIPKQIRKIWLLIASYYFYMSWNAIYVLLIGGSTIVTYISGYFLEIYNNRDSKREKNIVISLCFIINISILFIFKYGNFAIDTFNRILNILNVSVIQHRFDFLLPVGISFYTFQALGYIIDVYRGDIRAEKNFVTYALFVSFFPQLVAGPIERSKSLLAQIENVNNIKIWNAERITSGSILMVWGFFLKMVIADRISIIADNIYNNYMSYGSVELIIATVCFTIQIYCDFASYSTIAIGAAKIFGIQLMENFNAPYLATSIRDFWNRWHISLSTWFRDYLYIPLGGNRKGEKRKTINILIIFLVSGLWHGASWNYVAWGGIHGIYRIIEDFFSKRTKKILSHLSIKTNCFSWKFLKVVSTFLLINFAWIFFRSKSISDALLFIRRIFSQYNPWVLFNGEIYSLGLNHTQIDILIFSLIILLLVDSVKYKKNETIDTFLMSQNVWFEWIIVIMLIVMIFVLGEYGPSFDPQQFIYFQF